MKLNKLLSYLIFIVVIGLPFTVLAQTPADEGAVQPYQATYAELLAKAKATGKVRVIVTLDMDFEPEGRLNRSRAMRQRSTIVRVQDGLRRRLAGAGVQVLYNYKYTPSMALEVDAVALERLLTAPELVAIEEDVPETVALADSVGLVGANLAHQLGYTGKGWTVAVLDTGIDSSHDFLKGKVVSEACYSTLTDGSSSTSLCPNGKGTQVGPGSGINCSLATSKCHHGTHVAGIVAGNGPDFSGVAPEATLISMQVYYASGTNISSFPSAQKAALERVYELRHDFNIAAVNMSMQGGLYGAPCDSISRRQIIRTLTSANIAVIASAGNFESSIGLAMPACIPEVISVGSVDKNRQIAATSNSAPFLDFLAPGVAINSSIPGNEFGLQNGTSFAAPHVSGAWAVLKSKVGGGSVAQVKSALASTGLPMTDVRNGVTKPFIQIQKPLMADLTVTQTVDDPRPERGQAITYTVHVTNSGSLSLTTVAVSNTLPSGLSMAGAVSLNGLVGTISQTERGLSITAMTVAVGQAFQLTIPVQLDDSPPYTLSNQIETVAAEMIAPVTALTVITTPSNPTMTLSVTSSLSQAVVGQTISYSYRLTNTGNTILSDLSAVDSLLGPVTLTQSTLALGQPTTGVLSYTIRPSDLSGEAAIVVTATAQAASGERVTVMAQRPSVAVRAVFYLPIIERGASLP